MGCGITKKIGVLLLAMGLLAIQILFRSSVHADEGSAWKQFQTKSGECRIAFPEKPTLVQQSMQLSDGQGRLQYDIYLAPFEDKGVFMLLVATYPKPLMGGHEVAGLEGLLKGIVSHHPDNELIFAKLLQFAQHPALNFLVQSTSSYFRGQALMVGNKLYLVAMEGKKISMDEATFTKFLQSFQLLD